MFLADPLFQVMDYIQKYILISRPLFTTYSSESEFIYERHKPILWKMAQLFKGSVLCIIDVVSLHPNISHEKSLASIRRFLDARAEKKRQLKL